jgi:hypothetical protein
MRLRQPERVFTRGGDVGGVTLLDETSAQEAGHL